jgi:hypothetical protein
MLVGHGALLVSGSAALRVIGIDGDDVTAESEDWNATRVLAQGDDLELAGVETQRLSVSLVALTGFEPVFSP